MNESPAPTDPQPSTATGAPEMYDVVVIGGGFCGGATALLLREQLPEARILIVERETDYRRRVGEATVEVSAFMLHGMLGLYDHLSREHLPKHGLRYWLTDRDGRALHEMTEVGPKTIPSLPSFQLDRVKLDNHLLERAEAACCEVMRPARVREVTEDWPTSRVTIESSGGEARTVAARWLIDASGRHAFLARRKGLHQREERHPTAAVWGRWRGVVDLDAGCTDAPAVPLEPISASRRLATNHFMDYGWWCWVIPLAGGETSIGLVYNKDLFEPPGEGSIRERYEAFLRSWPGLSALIGDAELDEEDWMAYGHLPYKTEQYAGRGWALVGDAASFLDPFYSPGLDHASMSIFATTRMVAAHLRGELDDDSLDARLVQHNQAFTTAYDGWLEALYIDKYELMGDAELVAAAFLVDTALYYMGVVTPIHKDLTSLRFPSFGAPMPQAGVAHRIMRTWNRRLVRLARYRRRAGLYGRRNAGWTFLTKAPGLGGKSVPILLQGLGLWLRIEMRCLVHRLRKGRLFWSQPAPVPTIGDEPEPAST